MDGLAWWSNWLAPGNQRSAIVYICSWGCAAALCSLVVLANQVSVLVQQRFTVQLWE
jgi:hypothetical protein